MYTEITIKTFNCKKKCKITVYNHFNINFKFLQHF